MALAYLEEPACGLRAAEACSLSKVHPSGKGPPFLLGGLFLFSTTQSQGRLSLSPKTGRPPEQVD